MKVNRGLKDAKRFAGETFSADHDEGRLSTQLERVKALMADGSWRTLHEIGSRVEGSEAALSARLRDLRKTEHGSLTVERRRRGDAKKGLHEYRVLPRADDGQAKLFDGASAVTEETH